MEKNGRWVAQGHHSPQVEHQNLRRREGAVIGRVAIDGARGEKCGSAGNRLLCHRAHCSRRHALSLSGSSRGQTLHCDAVTDRHRRPTSIWMVLHQNR